MRLLFMFPSFTGILASCPPGAVYDSLYNRCYILHKEDLPFLTADRNCSSLGGNLVSLQNAFENSAVQALVGQTPGMMDRNIWIGASLLTSPTGWAWTDGRPYSYSNWAPGEPNNTNQCSTFSAMLGTWQTTPCSQAMPYLCELPADGVPTQAPCPAHCQSGWTYFDYTASCYKVLHGQDWQGAENQCLQLGAHLTSIHSDSENNFLTELTTTTMTMDWDGLTWFGMYKINAQTLTWNNSDGTPVDYINWDANKPDNPKSELCAQLISDAANGWFQTGRKSYWNDIKCTDTMRAFVCKKASTNS